MITVAGGDSFIWGTDLDQCTWKTPSKQTFTALLAKQHEFDYYCCAVPGNSNDAITRMVIDSCEKFINDKKVVIVSWSFPSRYEFHFNYNVDSPRGNWASVSPHNPKPDIKAFSDYFLKHVGSDTIYQHYNTLRSILLLQMYLETQSIPYLFTLADNVTYNPDIYKTNESLASMSRLIKWDSWYFFPQAEEDWLTTAPRGFYQWALENKYSIGPTGHPTEDAHKDAAELLKDKFNELVTQFNQ